MSDEDTEFEFVGLTETERVLAFLAPLPLFMIIAMLLAVFGNCAHFRTDKCSVFLCFAFRWVVILMVGTYIVILYLLILGMISVASPVEGDGAPNVFLFGVLAIVSGMVGLLGLCLCGGIRIGAKEEKKHSRQSVRGGHHHDRDRDYDHEEREMSVQGRA